jgi:glycogen debranching enzyme
LSELRGEAEARATWEARAEHVRAQVETRFWMPEAEFYGIAVDGEGALCRIQASNPGHLLFTGLVSPARARKVTERLLSPSFDSGWGIRTLAVGEARYNPMSYHNGSIWPHDTAVCTMGMARYGEREGVVRITSELFETAVNMGMRMPELFCGFPRHPGEAPVAYPVACLPQAWAAGSAFMMLQACLGMRIDALAGEIVIRDPRLPIGIDSLQVDGLRLGDETVDLAFERDGRRVEVHADGPARSRVRVRR